MLNTSPRRILVRCPNWVGDVVMVTPFLDALRDRFPDAHITFMLREYVKEVYSGSIWADSYISIENKSRTESVITKIIRMIKNIRQLRREKFDIAILLVNSFQSALEVWCAGIPYRLGYKREGRSVFLSEGPVPNRKDGVYVPGPMIPYYNKFGEYLEIKQCSNQMKLFVSREDDNEALTRLMRMGVVETDILIGLNPGGAFGASKFWMPEYFARVGDYYASKKGHKVIIFAGPNEETIANQIADIMHQKVLVSTSDKISLGGVKGIYKRLCLLITNDTGPRHFASAFGIPSVVLIGSTNPKWTENNDPYQVVFGKIPVCGPCHQRICPLNHQCMKSIKPEEVIEIAEELIKTKCNRSVTVR